MSEALFFGFYPGLGRKTDLVLGWKNFILFFITLKFSEFPPPPFRKPCVRYCPYQYQIACTRSPPDINQNKHAIKLLCVALRFENLETSGRYLYELKDQLKWFGHVNCRMPQERLPKQPLLAKANGKRSVRRLRTRWTNYIKHLGWNRLGLHPSEMMEMMEDREVRQLNIKLLPVPSLREGQGGRAPFNACLCPPPFRFTENQGCGSGSASWKRKR